VAAPGENSSWEPVNTEEPWDLDWCPRPSNQSVLKSGVLYSNNKSEKTHCFKAE